MGWEDETQEIKRRDQGPSQVIQAGENRQKKIEQVKIQAEKETERTQRNQVRQIRSDQEPEGHPQVEQKDEETAG